MNLEIFSVNIKRPEVQLEIEGVLLWFLLDTGAGKTVIKDAVPRIRKSENTVGVRSANGVVNKARLSEDVNIIDPVSGLQAKTQVILSPQCPVNLLGHDLIVQLKLALLPGKKGQIKIQRMTAEVNVLEGLDEPVPYWTLNVIENVSPANFVRFIKDKICELVLDTAEWHDPLTLHVTLRYGGPPDPKYDSG